MDLKAIYQKYKGILQPVMLAKNRLFSLRIHGGRGNQVLGLQQCRMAGCKISFAGQNNTVEIGDMSTLNGVSINIVGSGNRIVLGDRVSLYGCTFSIEDDGNIINLGSHTYIYNNTELAAIEGTQIDIGSDCLISSDVRLRTGDSHSILDETGKRINPSGPIAIADHVWLGNDVKVLKNARIAENCIVGTGSIVTHRTPCQPGTILVGSPAKATRTGVNWDQDRI